MNVCRLVKATTVVVLCVFPRVSSAADLKLAWDPSTDGVTTGYMVFIGQSSGSYSQQINVGATTSCTVTNLSPGTTYYFAVRGYDAAGDLSNSSNEISATTAAPAPQPISSLSLTPNLPSPELVGTSVNWVSA